MKKFFSIFVVAAIVLILVSFVYASNMPTNPYDVNKVEGNIKNTTKDIWATVILIVRIVAVGAVIFAGIRFMFASADQKADIKKGLIFLTIGAFLVFGATIIVDLVTNTAEDLTNTQNNSIVKPSNNGSDGVTDLQNVPESQ